MSKSQSSNGQHHEETPASSAGSVTKAIRILRRGKDERAAAVLVERYFAQLERLAYPIVRWFDGQAKAEDEQDAALAALTDVCLGLAKGLYLERDDREGLWLRLAQITERKAIQQLRRKPFEYDLRLMSSVKDVSAIPTAGKRLVIVAAEGHVLRFRIFDNNGKMVEDTDATQWTARAPQIEDLRKQLENLWPPHKLTTSEKRRAIDAVTSIVGHTQRFVPRSVPLPDGLVGVEPTPEYQAHVKMTIAQLMDEVEDPLQRLALYLRLKEYTVREIARSVDRTRACVNLWFQKIEKQWEKRHGESPIPEGFYRSPSARNGELGVSDSGA